MTRRVGNRLPWDRETSKQVFWAGTRPRGGLRMVRTRVTASDFSRFTPQAVAVFFDTAAEAKKWPFPLPPPRLRRLGSSFICGQAGGEVLGRPGLRWRPWRLREHPAVRSEIQGEGSAVQQVLVADDAQLLRQCGGAFRHRCYPYHFHQPARRHHFPAQRTLLCSLACSPLLSNSLSPARLVRLAGAVGIVHNPRPQKVSLNVATQGVSPK
ncbi:unnamed protein product [Musa acuminata subsp. malaccensis]|uniref:(wild Malaysian banana) hypothetical protein n=1 Tax=Musa acuminata subsp. malaccensis TaxID=214687 RepID=A0A804JIK6_MUSAM|nr:unnamed protein product [Musa acuminata subsp. malaccensis]